MFQITKKDLKLLLSSDVEYDYIEETATLYCEHGDYRLNITSEKGVIDDFEICDIDTAYTTDDIKQWQFTMIMDYFHDELKLRKQEIEDYESPEETCNGYYYLKG